MVYGPKDQVTPLVLHLGEAMIIDLMVEVKDLNGKIIETKKYEAVTLEAGRTVTELDAFRPKVDDGFYVLFYTIVKR